MKREYIDKLNGCKIGFYVNKEASGVDEDEEPSDVEYWIEEDNVIDWFHDWVIDLNEVDDSNWDNESWFKSFVEYFICKVINEDLAGALTLSEHADNEYIWLVLLYDEDGNVIEEIEELNPKSFM